MGLKPILELNIMSNNFNPSLILVLGIMAIIAAFILGKVFAPDNTVTITETVEVVSIDTLFIDKEPVIITETVTLVDTLIITETDTIITEVATIDTVFQEGKLRVDYFLTPKVFKLDWRPYPQEVIYQEVLKTEYIVEERAWWDTPPVLIGTGMLGTAILVALVK